MSLIVLYFLHSTSVLSFYIDVVLTFSIIFVSVTFHKPYFHRYPRHWNTEDPACTMFMSILLISKVSLLYWDIIPHGTFRAIIMPYYFIQRSRDEFYELTQCKWYNLMVLVQVWSWANFGLNPGISCLFSDKPLFYECWLNSVAPWDQISVKF